VLVVRRDDRVRRDAVVRTDPWARVEAPGETGAAIDDSREAPLPSPELAEGAAADPQVSQ